MEKKEIEFDDVCGVESHKRKEKRKKKKEKRKKKKSAKNKIYIYLFFCRFFQYICKILFIIPWRFRCVIH